MMSSSTGSSGAAVAMSLVWRHVAADGMEEPQRRVGRVVQALALAVREHVGDQPVARVLRERPKDQRRFARAASRQRQTFQADHRVASPVREPVIAGNHGSRLGAVRQRPGRVIGTCRRRDEELIGREDEFGRKPVACRSRRLREQLAAAQHFGLECCRRRKRLR